MTPRPEGMPYDPTDGDSILEYAGRLTGRRCSDILRGSACIGGASDKGRFGQMIEEGYFLIESNNRPSPDFEEAGIELKTAPVKRDPKRGVLVSKERMVLGIIDYNEVPEKGFDMFLEKSSRILMVFYLWERDEPAEDHRILKVVDWEPSPEELRVIREDWGIIERYVMEGRAHLLSERCTRFLAACTKGAGHGGDMRPQPFSDIPAKQRALSFKPSFVNMIFETCPDVNEGIAGRGAAERFGTLFDREWSEDQLFEDHVLERFDRFVGKDCAAIEGMLGIDLDPRAKSYYSTLCVNMMGIRGKKRVREFVQAGISMKTMRIRADGMPKESMSFPSFDYAEVAEHSWEDSDFRSQIDRRFFFPVFRLPAGVGGIGRKEPVFLGAFFWSMPDGDFETAHQVWEDTKRRILLEDFDHFTAIRDGRVCHVRPHGRDSGDTREYGGRNLKKLSFWLNARYLKDVVAENLGVRPGGRGL